MKRLQVKEKYIFLNRNKYMYLSVRCGNVINFVVFHDDLHFFCSPFVSTFTVFPQICAIKISIYYDYYYFYFLN